MGTLAYIAPWVLSSVFIGVIVGFYLGRGRGKSPEASDAERQRQATLKVLLELLNSAEQINSNVECHNTELRENARHVKDMVVDGEMESVKMALLGQMAQLLHVNKDLQEDLTCTRYRLEEQAQVIDHVRREARTDELTSVANRKAFNEKLHLLLDDHRRHGEPFVLILIDLDNFKRINDAHGHPAGDRVLSSVGQWLQEGVREGDFVGRFGGDEFAVLLPLTDLAVGMDVAERLRASAAQRASRDAVRSGQVTVSLSIGVAASRPEDSEESILQRADEALYRSKNLGRNQVQCEEPDAPSGEHFEHALA